jgi:hypothetical protein
VYSPRTDLNFFFYTLAEPIFGRIGEDLSNNFICRPSALMTVAVFRVGVTGSVSSVPQTLLSPSQIPADAVN